MKIKLHEGEVTYKLDEGVAQGIWASARELRTYILAAANNHTPLPFDPRPLPTTGPFSVTTSILVLEPLIVFTPFAFATNPLLTRYNNPMELWMHIDLLCLVLLSTLQWLGLAIKQSIVEHL